MVEARLNTMNTFGFKADTKITDILGKGTFTLSAEVIPPRNGTEQAQLLTQIESLVRSGAEFLSVTKGAGGSLRGGSLPIAQAIKERFAVPCIAHFTCRDLTPQEVENQLIDHAYFGIRNILALRGDPPQDQPNWSPREGSYTYAYQLIDQIRSLNDGNFLGRKSDLSRDPQTISEKTDFSIGCAVYPEHPNESERIEFLRAKVDRGAEFAISQMLFDEEVYARYLERCHRERLTIPILPGTRLVKTRVQAQKMAERFMVSFPRKLMDKLAEVPGVDAQRRAEDAFADLIEGFKKAGAPGVHLFVLSDTVGSSSLINRLAKKRASR
jgi:methylenetetrahydrofolate reductase (NADPH)